MEPNRKQLEGKDTLPWAWINAVYDELTTEPFEDQAQLPAQVLPWLFISDLPSLINTARLLDQGITHVLTTNKMYSTAELDKFKKRISDAGIQQLAV